MHREILHCIGVTDQATATILNWYGGGMAFEQRDMSGSLFKNKKREKDTHPNATGTCMVAGVEYEVAAWTKPDKNGNPWQSLSFKPKSREVISRTGIRHSPSREPGDDDDAPPF